MQSTGTPRGATETKAGKVGIRTQECRVRTVKFVKKTVPTSSRAIMCKDQSTQDFLHSPVCLYTCLQSVVLKFSRKYYSPGWYFQSVILPCHSCSVSHSEYCQTVMNTHHALSGMGRFWLLAAPLVALRIRAGLQPTWTAQCPGLDTVTYSSCLLVKHTRSPGSSRSYM